MADDITLNAGSAGDTLAADDIASVKYQRVKLIHGADGTNDGDVSTANPYPVDIYLGGVAGVAGAGAVTTGVQRITLASDDPAVALLTGMDVDTDAIATAAAAIQTAVELIDDAIYVDDVPFTAGSNKVMAAGFRYDDTTPDGVTQGDVGYARMSSARELYTVVRDAGGNERGMVIDASGFPTVNVNGTVQAAQSGTWNITNVSGTVSLPTGAATETKQDTIIGHVDGIESALGDAVTALQIIDDWDESNRAKVNLIVGQAGVAAGSGAVGVTTQRVVLATDDPAVALLTAMDADTSTLAAAVSGTEVQVDVVGALPAGTNAIGKLAANSGVDIGDVDVTSIAAGTNLIGDVGIGVRTSGGYTMHKTISAATTNATSVKASAGQVYSIQCGNVNASARYLKLYNKASAPTVGTDTPVKTLIIPGNTAGTGFVHSWPAGLAFGTGIAFALTTEATDAGTTAVAANEINVNIDYA